MSRFEEIVGNIMATILTMIFILSVAYTLFSLLFRDGRGVAMYGGRGEVYMAE